MMGAYGSLSAKSAQSSVPVSGGAWRLSFFRVIGVLAMVAERVRFPFPMLLVIAGLLIGLIPNLPEARLDPELVFLIFLPPLLFSTAWNFPWEDFRSNFLAILALAVGPVFATILLPTQPTGTPERAGGISICGGSRGDWFILTC